MPVVVREVADDRELLELALVENLQRSDLNPIEEAEAYAALQEKFGLSQEEVAARVGKARTTVTNSLRLLRLPDEVRELLREGRLTAGQARPAARRSQTPRSRSSSPSAPCARGSRPATSSAWRPRRERSAKSKKPDRPVEVHTAAAEEKLTRRLQTRVEIRRQGKGGHLRIHFHSEEELMRLYDVLIERGDIR